MYRAVNLVFSDFSDLANSRIPIQGTIVMLVQARPSLEYTKKTWRCPTSDTLYRFIRFEGPVRQTGKPKETAFLASLLIVRDLSGFERITTTWCRDRICYLR